MSSRLPRRADLDGERGPAFNDRVVYAMRPVGEVQPVQVSADDTVVVLLDALDALDLFGERLLDVDWLSGDTGSAAVADAARLGAALERYAALALVGIGELLRRANCAPGAADALEQFFGFVGATAGQDLLIERLR